MLQYSKQGLGQVFLNSIALRRQAVILSAIFWITLLLVSPTLTPHISAVNPDDEAKYVESGWRLLKGNVRDLAWGPLVAVVYAPIHLFAQDSPDWFMLETWVGRFILFAFLWWCTIYLAWKVFDESQVLFIAAGILFVLPAYLFIIKNQSDAVFAGFSMLSLAQLTCFARTCQIRNLQLASLFVGLGILARVETVVLIVSLSILGLITARRFLPALTVLLSAIVPAVVVIGLYFAASLLLMGSINLGVAGKSYDSFEMNQAVLTGGDIELARQEARRYFGTQEENRSSILRAVARNPAAFGPRILANIKNIPADYFVFFGKKLGATLLLFAAWGGYVLARRKAYQMLFVLGFWILHVFVALGFLALHIIPQSSYLFVLLGAVGIEGAFSERLTKTERRVFLFLLLLLIALSGILGKPAFMLGLMPVGLVLGLYWVMLLGWSAEGQAGQIALMLLLAAGLILREPFPFPNFPALGQSGEEQAIHYLAGALPSQAQILAPTPLAAIAARMVDVKYDAIPAEIQTPAALSAWLTQENISAVYLDERFRTPESIHRWFDSGSAQGFSLGFESADSSIRVYLPK